MYAHSALQSKQRDDNSSLSKNTFFKMEAEKEAKDSCYEYFNITNKNPDHWSAAISCGMIYTYICENMSRTIRVDINHMEKVL